MCMEDKIPNRQSPATLSHPHDTKDFAKDTNLIFQSQKKIKIKNQLGGGEQCKENALMQCYHPHTRPILSVTKESLRYRS